MIDQQIQAYCRSKSFHPKTQERWLGLSEADREALLQLAEALKAGENHFKDLLDSFEEIALRDGIGIATLLREDLSRITSDPRLGRNDKLKRLKEELWRLRFPRLAHIEMEIQRRVREMKLNQQMQVSVPPGLESGAVTVQVKATDCDEMKRLIGDLVRLSEGEQMKQIFALLRGETT